MIIPNGARSHENKTNIAVAMYNGIEPKNILLPSSWEIGIKQYAMKTYIIAESWLKIKALLDDAINAIVAKIIKEDDAIFASSKFETCLNFAPSLRCGLSTSLKEAIGIR